MDLDRGLGTPASHTLQHILTRLPTACHAQPLPQGRRPLSSVLRPGTFLPVSSSSFYPSLNVTTERSLPDAIRTLPLSPPLPHPLLWCRALLASIRNCFRSLVCCLSSPHEGKARLCGREASHGHTAGRWRSLRRPPAGSLVFSWTSCPALQQAQSVSEEAVLSPEACRAPGQGGWSKEARDLSEDVGLAMEGAGLSCVA